MPRLPERYALATITLMQIWASSHIATPLKKFLIQMFGDDKIISKGCRFSWSPLFEIWDPPRGVICTFWPAALCRLWICDLPAMCYRLWWRSRGTHSVVINNSETFCSLFAYLCLTWNVCNSYRLFFFSFSISLFFLLLLLFPWPIDANHANCLFSRFLFKVSSDFLRTWYIYTYLNIEIQTKNYWNMLKLIWH